MIQLTLGRRGQGKSTLSYYVARQSPCRMIFDPRGLFRSRASAVATSSHEVHELTDDLLAGTETEIVVTPGARTDVVFDAFCGCAARVIRARPSQSFAVVVDEIRFVDLGNDTFDWILRTSDVDRVRVICTGHRPKDVPTDIRAIADTWALFQFTLPRDLAVIEEQCSDAVAQQVQRLKLRHFVEWDDRTGTARMFSDPSRWYLPLIDAGDDGPDRPVLESDPPAASGKLWDI